MRPMRVWTAEVVVDEALVRRLVAQFPHLTTDSLRLLSEGWDRSVWLLNEQWVFGFPRRAIAVPGIEREIALLPQLGPLLPLPIPRPVFAGRPTRDYPWPFSGSVFLPGRELCDVELDARSRARIALEMAAFLKRLHSPEVADAIAAPQLPADPTGRADMGQRVEKTRGYLAELGRLGLWRRPAAVGRLFDEAEKLPPPDEPTSVVHGDLHFRHLLVQAGRVSGVIDWVDLCRADPAVDLQLVWSLLDPPERAAFLDAYGPVTDEQLLRARVLALSLCAALAHYGHEEGMRSVEREALAGLGRTLAHWAPHP